MNTNEKIIDLCIDGLLTDGAHHKQWFLEEIIRTLVGDEELERIISMCEGEIERGIPD